ncbi:MAG TPA: hypothetical protein VGY76_14315 [Solirubrobacteraceae bacterium]|jgi:hypothetical protein|nr:hypothetical protein [Solirubrobacteraceae bacterium]
MLSILGGTIAVLAFSATSSFAFWESASSQTTGTATVLKSGEFKYPGNGSVTCEAKEIVGQWQIQGAGQIKGQQKITTKGPHLQLQIKKWGNNCKAGLVGAEVGECDFQLVQQEKEMKATGGVAKIPCVVKIPAIGCTIQVPTGMEAPQGSGKGINVGLKEVELSNVGSNQLDKVKITNTAGGQGQLAGEGIFAQASGCPNNNSTEEAELTGLEFEAVGVNAV